MNRQELNMWFLQIDWSTSEVKKEIIVNNKNKTVEILSQGPGGYSSSKQSAEFPMKYALDRIKDSIGCKYRDLSEYKIIVIE